MASYRWSIKCNCAGTTLKSFRIYTQTAITIQVSGMASKKGAAVHCRIFIWLEDTDPEFADAIKRLCLEGALNPGRFFEGITFLYPTEETRSAIISGAHGNEAAARKTVETIRSHIIPLYLPNATAFKQAAADERLGNLHRKTLPLGDTSAKEVNLGSARITPNKTFKQLVYGDRETNLSVWDVTEGEVPQDGAEYTPPRRPRNKKKGGAGFAGGSTHGGSSVDRAGLTASLMGRLSGDPHCFTKAMNGLLLTIQSDPELYSGVVPMLCASPIISWYILAEPHKAGGHMLPDSLFERHVDSDVGAFAQAFSDTTFNTLGEETGAKVFSDHAGLRNAVETVRSQIWLGYKDDMNGLSGQIQDVYTQIMDTNSVAGFGPVLPLKTQQLLGDSASKKLWQDEFHCEMAALEREGDYEGMTQYALSHPGDDYDGERCLTKSPAGSVEPASDHRAQCKFLTNIPCFLGFARPASAVVATGGDADRGDYDRPADYTPSEMYAVLGSSSVTGGGTPDIRTVHELYHHLNAGMDLPPAFAKVVRQFPHAFSPHLPPM